MIDAENEGEGMQTMTGPPSLRSVVVINNSIKMNLWSKGLFGLRIRVHHQEKPRQEFKAGTEAETKMEHCLLNCSICFLIQLRTTCPEDSTTLLGIGPFYKNLQSRKFPTDLPRGHFLN